ncbi:conserved protein of unknown function [Tenacibaculum sp. 190524A02b]|uniref:hypothetical protein n=1 Tax=Tenacibaculum vairaonense TaxID=3137860 RepID=UPI0032B27AE3
MPLELKTRKEEYAGGNDSIAIKKYIHGKEGGAVLDVEGFPDDYIYAGHGVILEGNVYKPQPVDGTKHELLIGVVRSTTKKSMPSTGVMTIGVINNNTLKYPFNEESLKVLEGKGIKNQVD